MSGLEQRYVAVCDCGWSTEPAPLEQSEAAASLHADEAHRKDGFNTRVQTEPFGQPCPHGLYHALDDDVIVTVCAKCFREEMA